MHIRRFYAPTNRESESGIGRDARCPGWVISGHSTPQQIESACSQEQTSGICAGIVLERLFVLPLSATGGSLWGIPVFGSIRALSR